MLGDTHRLVANLALACLDIKERHILYPRWGGIESGATLSDDFKIMWEPEESHSDKKQLVHRCYVNSDRSKDHGCAIRAWDHSVGSISFIEDYQNGKLDGYEEDDFLENLGMFLGISCHHIADLCTPVHVGQVNNPAEYGFKTISKLHSRVERDIVKYTPLASLQFKKPRIVKLTKNYYWKIAQYTYESHFIKLKDIYPLGKICESNLIAMISDLISNSIYHTACVWHTVLKTTKMSDRKWSMQPLL